MNPVQTNPQDILNALSALGANISGQLPPVSIPSLNLQFPNAQQLEDQYQQFLTRAAQDPDIINYYSQLLNQAQGDITLAQNQMENDYQTGVRNTQANLTATLKQLGLTNTQEQQNLQNSLNQRGIALTQNDNGTLTYAGGGQPATELQNLNQSQQLRQEAEQRSANQQTQGLQIQLQKGLTSSGQNLAQYGQNLAQQKQSDIANRANQYFGLYQSGLSNQAQQAQYQQQNQILNNPPNTNYTYNPNQQRGGMR